MNRKELAINAKDEQNMTYAKMILLMLETQTPQDDPWMDLENEEKKEENDNDNDNNNNNNNETNLTIHGLECVMWLQKDLIYHILKVIKNLVKHLKLTDNDIHKLFLKQNNIINQNNLIEFCDKLIKQIEKLKSNHILLLASSIEYILKNIDSLCEKNTFNEQNLMKIIWEHWKQIYMKNLFMKHKIQNINISQNIKVCCVFFVCDAVFGFFFHTSTHNTRYI